MSDIAAAGPAKAAGGASASFLLLSLALSVVAICAADVGHPLPLVVLVVFGMMLCALARVGVRTLVAYLLPLGSFFVFGLLLILVLPARQGSVPIPVPLVGPRGSVAGLRFLSTLTLKSALVLLFVVAYTRWVSERDILAGLTALHLPPRLAALAYLIIRNLRVVRDEVRRVLRARDARGKPRGLRAVRVAGAISNVLLVRLGIRAEAMAFALCARGYRGGLPVVEPGHLSPREGAALLSYAAALAALLVVARGLPY